MARSIGENERTMVHIIPGSKDLEVMGIAECHLKVTDKVTNILEIYVQGMNPDHGIVGIIFPLINMTWSLNTYL